MLLSLLSLSACNNPNEIGNDSESKESVSETVSDNKETVADNKETENPTEEFESIAILYENDVHCAIEGYSKLAAMKAELKASYDHVGVVSSGDFVQGGTIGAVSKGEYIVRLMNIVGYDAITLGNHEFDYLLERLNELNSISNTKFISCNFAKIGESKT